MMHRKEDVIELAGFTDARQQADVNASEPSTDEHCDRRKCAHVYDDGRRCNGWKVKGEALCAGHLRLGIAADPHAYGQRGSTVSAQVRAERAQIRAEQRKSVSKRLDDRAAAFLEREDVQQAIEERWLAILRNGGDADAIRLLKDLTDRVYGTAIQRTKDETLKTPADIEAIRAMSSEERRAFIRAASAAAAGQNA
jgi:hypothetical protein